MLQKQSFLLDPDAPPSAGSTTEPTPPIPPDTTPPAESTPHVDDFKALVKQVTDIRAAALAGKDLPGTTTPQPPVPPPSQPSTPTPASIPNTPTTEGYTPKKSEDWKKLHAELDTYRSKAETLEKQLADKNREVEEARKAKVDPEELTRIKAERDTLEEKLERVAIEQSPKFVSHYDKIFSQATNLAKDAVGTEMAELAETLLSRPPSKSRKESLNELLGKLESDIDRTNLALAVQQMDSARAERDALLADKKATLAKIKESEQAEALQRQQIARSQAEDRAKKALERAAAFLAFKPVDGDEKHNTAISTRQEKIRKAILGNLTPDELADMAILAEEGRHVVENVLPPLIAELKAQQDAMRSATAADPAKGGHHEPSATPAQEDDYVKAVLKQMRG